MGDAGFSAADRLAGGHVPTVNGDPDRTRADVRRPAAWEGLAEAKSPTADKW